MILIGIVPGWALSRFSRLQPRWSYAISAGITFWTALVTALAYLSLVRYAVLFLAGLLGILAVLRLSPKPNTVDPNRIKLWDALEQPAATMRQVGAVWRSRVRRGLQSLRARYGLIGLTLIVIAFLWAIGFGSWPMLRQAAPGTPNGYVNLLRIASLTSNTGVYPAGVAPTGISAFGAALTTVFFLPPLDVLRFLYPLADVLTVAAVGALAQSVTQSGRTSALAMFLTSVSSLAHLGFPINFESPLAMHWALILVLFSWAHTVEWFRQPDRLRGGLVVLALLGTSLMSPPEALVAIVGIGAFAYSRRRDSGGWRLFMAGLAAVIAGLIPLAVGLATGHPLAPDGWLVVSFPALSPIWRAPSNQSFWVIWTALAVVALSWRQRTPVTRSLGWTLAGLAVLAGLLANIASVAAMILWSDILGLLVLILALDLVMSWAKKWLDGPWTPRLAYMGLAVLGAIFPSGTVTLRQYEPPLAAQTTLRIENNFPPYQWTIVSPVQQYSEVLARGWHEELSSFVSTYSLSEAQNPHYELKNDTRYPIVTPDVFIFVEPHLFPSGQPLSRRDLRFSVGSGALRYTGNSLKAIESRAFYWVLAYHRTHPRTSEFYVRSRNLMVLWIRQ